MKELLIVRHAKSDWKDSSVPDIDRPLNDRGLRNAPEMAARLKNRPWLPQVLVSSPAVRAFTTAKAFESTLGFPPGSITLNKSIYEAGTRTLLQVINSLDNSKDRIALFGHNPGLTQVVNYLCDAGIDNIPTCGMALIRFETDQWKEVSGDLGELIWFDYPKIGLD
jgi:phosphohistidine phosphatase